MKDFSDLRCDWFHAEDLRNIADERRNLLWPEDSMPIDIEFLISRRLNINIEPIKGLFKTLSSNCFLSFDRSIIKVDQYAYMSGRFEGKINFDLAHEVGHFFCMRKFINISKNKYYLLMITTISKGQRRRGLYSFFNTTT